MAKHIASFILNKDYLVRILHYDDDPTSWIVRKYKKQLWWKKRTCSVWFNDENQALKYVKKLKEKCEKGLEQRENGS